MGETAGGGRIGIVNGLPDTLEMLEIALQQDGFETVAVLARDVREGNIDLPTLARSHRLAAIVYDIAIPYEANWKFLQRLQGSHGAELPPIVLTTTNLRGIADFAGSRRVVEILGKPYDLGELVKAVRLAILGEHPS
jgi:DNA-binding response OmpR family regulator